MLIKKSKPKLKLENNLSKKLQFSTDFLMISSLTTFYGSQEVCMTSMSL